MNARATFLFAGGGTGGHVFPAIAVAEALRGLADVDVVFCGTDRGLEARVVPRLGWRLERLDVGPMRGGGLGRAAAGAARALRATARAFGLLRRVRPRAVLGVGGYASGPVSLAAVALGVPLAVLEPNSSVGLANRLLAPVARRAYIAWDEVAPSFRPGSWRSFGVPLRAGFAPAPAASHPAVRVLVMGGSRGAAALNELLPQAVAHLAARGQALQVLHQAGRDQDEGVRSAYARAGIEGVVVVPFIDDVARAIADADLVVARAGAVTIAEITAIGRASILVPFPHAAGDHQGRNAEALARAGAAECVRQDAADPLRLAHEMERLVEDDALRSAMATAARGRGRPMAARDVAVDLLALSGLAARSATPGAA